MKNIKLFICICTGIFFAACSSPGEEDNGNGNNNSEFVLLSTTPTQNEVVSLTTPQTTFTFNKNIQIADKNKITRNGSPVANVSAAEKILTIVNSGLKAETNYIFTIGIGAIKDDSNNFNQKVFTLEFSTETSEPEPEPGISKDLVMPNASPQAKKVYLFLLDNYETKIISGAMAKVNWNTEEADRVYRWTGKFPALNCFDFIHHYYSPANWIDYGNTAVVEDWWNNKGLVAAMWHWNVPKSSGSAERAFYTNETTFDITKAVQAGTAENKQIMEDMDIIAGYLLALQNKNIPVIWRPLHEASGGWFWWGAKGAEPCKKLWIIMFDYFKSKGINNLIWVWTAEANDNAWYPGDAYVDLIGRDIYNKTTASAMATEYKNLKKRYPNKIIALSECGNVATISSQWNAGAQWSWFMPWYDFNATDESKHQHAGKDFWEDAFNCDFVITRDQMPSLK
ncbi:MAG: Ig-like domain-containing protein [Dysgonamonadaceae bacterium]|nr:Ig-like domain-containing protein [Dysgonamonadaceae bacterium]